MRKKVTIAQARRAGKKLGVNFDVLDVKTLQMGMNSELEHGRRYRVTNVTNDNLEMTCKIALAHLMEYINYYDELKVMEDKLKRSHKPQLNIFL